MDRDNHDSDIELQCLSEEETSLTGCQTAESQPPKGAGWGERREKLMVDDECDEVCVEGKEDEIFRSRGNLIWNDRREDEGHDVESHEGWGGDSEDEILEDKTTEAGDAEASFDDDDDGMMKGLLDYESGCEEVSVIGNQSTRARDEGSNEQDPWKRYSPEPGQSLDTQSPVHWEGSRIPARSIRSYESRRSRRGGSDDMLRDVFIDMAKDKLEELMKELLEGMFERLKNRRKRSYGSDVEAAPRSPDSEFSDSFGGYSGAHEDSRSRASIKGYDSEIGGDIRSQRTKSSTSSELQTIRWLVYRERRSGSLRIDSNPDTWANDWSELLLDADEESRRLRLSLANELAVAIYNSDYFQWGSDPIHDGHLRSIVTIIGHRIIATSDTEIVKSYHFALPLEEQPLDIILLRIIIILAKCSSISWMKIREMIGICTTQKHNLRPFMSTSKPTLDDVHLVIEALSIIIMSQALTYKDPFFAMTRCKKVHQSHRDYHRILRHCLRLTFTTLRENTYNQCRYGSVLTPPKRLGSDVENFSTRDLRLSSLIDLGKLRISWTQDPAEHLAMDGKVINLFWFGRGDDDVDSNFYIKDWLYFGELPNKPSNKIQEKELESTLRIVLGHRTKGEAKAKRRAYGSVHAPNWFDVPPHVLNKPRLSYYMEKFPPDGTGGMNAHLSYGVEPEWENEFKKYADFPIYGERIRALRKHMDSVSPSDLRGLLKDKRNIANYHTFWFAVIFGTASICLALASLVVSSAQTWAAFHPPNSNDGKSP